MQLSHQTLVYVNQYSGQLQRIYMLKNSLFDITFAMLKEEKPSTKNSTDQALPTKISYREQEIRESSSLKQFKDTVGNYQIKGEWNGLRGPLQESITVCMITEKKDKKTS